MSDVLVKEAHGLARRVGGDETVAEAIDEQQDGAPRALRNGPSVSRHVLAGVRGARKADRDAGAHHRRRRRCGPETREHRRALTDGREHLEASRPTANRSKPRPRTARGGESIPQRALDVRDALAAVDSDDLEPAHASVTQRSDEDLTGAAVLEDVRADLSHHERDISSAGRVEAESFR